MSNVAGVAAKSTPRTTTSAYISAMSRQYAMNHPRTAGRPWGAYC
ncbi:MAG: hypothetical protein WBD40_14455 [Tepidisphaeraceae bacterium]